jgi:hypothetical protein
MADSLPNSPPPARDLAHGALRGAVAAMAMTGMRTFTVNVGIVGQAPPQAIVRQRIPGMGRSLRGRPRRRVLEEVFHWTYGAAGGAAFAALPPQLRAHRWAGPAYGLAIWLSFEAGIAPLLQLKQAGESRPAERAALAIDHLLYGLILTEGRRDED